MNNSVFSLFRQALLAGAAITALCALPLAAPAQEQAQPASQPASKPAAASPHAAMSSSPRQLTMPAFMPSALPPEAAGTYQIDAVHSSIEFDIMHLGVSYVGGRFNDFSGQIHLDLEDPSKSHMKVTVKIESVDTGNDRRDNHLRSADFFNAEEHPEMTFASKSVREIHPGVLEVTGDFTMMGTSKELTTYVMLIGAGDDTRGNYRAGGVAVFQIKRSDYGMTGWMDSLGDDVAVEIQLEGIRQQDGE